MTGEWYREGFVISTDKARIDLDVVYGFLHNSYWAEGISKDVVCRSIDHSFTFGIYRDEQQVGFARVVTDYATFAYLADVFVLEQYRKRGLARWLMEVIVSHPSLQGLRRWLLFTKDAHALYRRFGFAELRRPERAMERHDPGVCLRRC